MRFSLIKRHQARYLTMVTLAGLAASATEAQAQFGRSNPKAIATQAGQTKPKMPWYTCSRYYRVTLWLDAPPNPSSTA